MAAAVLPSAQHIVPDPFQMSARPPDPAPAQASSPKTFKRFRSSLEQTLRSATRSKAKSPQPPPLDDCALPAKGKQKEDSSLDVFSEESPREKGKDKEKSKMLKRLESKMLLRRQSKEAVGTTSTPDPALNAKKGGRIAGFTSFITPSLRQASMSSPALHLSSQALPSPKSESFSPNPTSPSSNASALLSPHRDRTRRSSAVPSSRDISAPIVLASKRQIISGPSNVNPSPKELSSRKARPSPLPLSPSTSSLLASGSSYSPSPSPVPGTPRRARSPISGISPPSTPTPTSSGSRGHVIRKASANASTSHLPVNSLGTPTTPRARSPVTPRTRIASPGISSRSNGLASASTSHLPLHGSSGHTPSPSSSSSNVRRPSFEANPARRPSLDVPSQTKRPSLDYPSARRPSLDISPAARRPSFDISPSRGTSLDARPSLDARRPSLDAPTAHRPSLDGSSGVRRPSVETPRTSSPSFPRATTPTRPRAISPTINRPWNASSTSLASSPSNPAQRELIRAASSLLCKELARPPTPTSGNKSPALPTSSSASRDWEEVEVRMRALVRMERIWGKSGTGGSSSQVNVNAGLSSSGLSVAGEDRERRHFAEALRDGFVLCQLMNRFCPGSIARVDPREDGFVRTSNVTKFLASCTSHGLLQDDIFLRDDLIEQSSESLARVAKTVLALPNLANGPPDRSRYITGGGQVANMNSPYGQPPTGSRGAAASTPNLSLMAQRSASPAMTNRKRWSPPGAGLPTLRSNSPSTSRSGSDGRETDNGTIAPQPPPRSPLRIRTSSFGVSGSPPSARTVSVADSTAATLAESTTGVRQSVASSSAATDTTTFSSLLEVQRTPSGVGTGSAGGSGGANKFGTIRTVTTEATSFAPSDAPSFTRTEASSVAANMAEELARKRGTDPAGYTSLNSPSSKVRERKPSETAPIDLSRVTEEEESSASSGKKDRDAERRERERAERERVERIHLGKGKWPEDFTFAFPQNPTQPIAIPRAPFERDDVTRNPLGISPPRKLAVVSEAVSVHNGSAESLSYIGPRRPTHRPRHSVDTPTLLPKTTPIGRDPSPDASLPSPRLMLRRSSTKTSMQRSGMYVPRDGNDEPRSSLDSVQVPFPRAVSGEHGTPSPTTSTGSHFPPNIQSTSEVSLSGPSRPHIPPRGRFQSEVDGASSRRRPRPSSYDDLGAKPGRSRYESMMNLGVASGNTSASDLMARDSMSRDSLDGSSAMRQSLIVREEGKPPTHFQLGNCIGRGQFGSVYRALNLNTGQMVAVKRIRLEGLKEEEVTQLMREVDLLKSLSHPSIVKYEGMTRDVAYLNIVLEYAENGSLGQTLKAFGKLNERLVAGYVVKILEGLHYLHRSDVVHCDLKAANILTTKNGNIKLSDFGVSLNLRAMEREIRNDVAGTPNWMAPEVIELKGASPKSDIWSLACTVIELLTGRPPYADIPNGMSVMFRIVEDEMPPLPEGCSELLQDFLRDCFQKDPTLRPSAELLFEHQWLKKNWGAHKELRPQDSIPFLRRVSTDLQKSDAVRFFTNFENPPPDSPSTDPQRRSMDMISGTPPQHIPSDPFPSGLDGEGSQLREHAFVKTTFGKPVICRVCLQNVKKSAVLCQECSLIAHSKCAINAPPTCDLRAQLLLYARYSSQGGSPGNQYSNSAEFPGRQQDSSTSLLSEPLLATRPLSPGSDAPTISGAIHPPTAFKMFGAFKRSKSSLAMSPEPGPSHSGVSITAPSHSGASMTTLGPREDEDVVRKKPGVLKRSRSSRPQSLSSTSTPNTSSVRTTTTISESISSRHEHGPKSAQSGAIVDASVSHGRVSFADTDVHPRSLVSAGQRDEITTPGDLPSEGRRHRKRDSKSSSQGCVIQ